MASQFNVGAGLPGPNVMPNMMQDHSSDLTLCTQAFRFATPAVVEELTLSSFLNAVKSLLPLYQVLFKSDMVKNVLMSDITNHIREFEMCAGSSLEASLVNPVSLTQQLRNEMTMLGGSRQVHKHPSTLAHATLLLTRTALFIAQFCRNLAERPLEKPSAMARVAYDAVLRPHHNFAIMGIVKAALSLVPSRQELLLAFKYPSEEIAIPHLFETASAIEASMRPVAQWLLTNDLDWN